MKYKKIVKAEFISRPNRFVAEVMIDGRKTTVHVKNTGRCKELLIPGATVYLEDFTEDTGDRKTPYSLIGVEKVTDSGILMVNMDSQAPNKAVKEALENNTILLPGMGETVYVKPEVTKGESRLDFFVRDKDGTEGYIEVKGVTLEDGGEASFPDAPTKRGIKHLSELSDLASCGFNAYAVFIVQMEGMKCFTPNKERDPAFANALVKAKSMGVNILAYECRVTENEMIITKPVEVVL